MMRISSLRHVTVVLCLWAALSGLSSQTMAQWTMGGRAVAMAKAGTALPSDNWAVFHNPALIDVEERHFGLFAIRYYGLRELEDHAAVITFPGSFSFRGDEMSFGVAAGIHSYGFKLFRETQIRGGWSIRRKRLRFGMVMNYVHLQISGYGSTGLPAVDTGLAVELIRGFRVGYRVANLFLGGSGYGEIDRYPAEMAIGLSWNGMPRLLMTSELVKDVLYPVSFRTAMEWEGVAGIFFRGGWTTAPLTWSTGAGFQLSRVTANIAVQKHPVLGLSPGIDFSFTF